MIRSTLLLLIFTSTVQLNGQTKSELRPYRTWITKTDGIKVAGYLSGVNNEYLSLSNSNYQGNAATGQSLNELHLLKIPVTDIEKIRLRKKGKVGRSALIGLAVGIVVGGIIGYADGDDPAGWFSYTAEEKAISASLSLGLIGGVVGTLFGFTSKGITINGNKETFSDRQLEISQYAKPFSH